MKVLIALACGLVAFLLMLAVLKLQPRYQFHVVGTDMPAIFRCDTRTGAVSVATDIGGYRWREVVE